MINRRFYTLVAIIVLCCSCARIVPPKGGDKDTTPPMVKRTVPGENTLGFNTKEFKIEFDEYISLDDAQSKLIVSPPLKKKPEIVAKLKTLYVRGLDSLQPNTTYIFDFGDAVVDFNEGNHLPKLTYCFSTGEEIDSLQYEGVLLNAYTLKAEAGKYVALYPIELSKQDRKTILPQYITRTDIFGKFSFRNIKDGQYSIMAYSDENQNLLFDLPNEGIGFLTHSVEAYQTTDSLATKDTIFFCPAKDTILKLENTKLLSDRELTLTFSAMLTDSFDIHFLNPTLDNEDIIIEKNISDTLSIVNIYAVKEKVFDSVIAQITEANNFNEKIEIAPNSRMKKQKENKKFKFSCPKTNLSYFDTLTIACNFPVIEQVKAMLIDDKDTADVIFLPCKGNSKLLHCNTMLKENTNYILKIDTSVVKNLRGQINDSLQINLQTDKIDDYSSLTITLNSDNWEGSQVILSLFDSQNQRVGSDIILNENKKTALFENLKEGTYKLRAITDKNLNGLWDACKFDLDLPAEKVQYFPKKLSIRKGWDFQEEWKISL